MTGPLAGVRIIEVGHMLMGPYCGMILGDLGAEVIKIEPRSGDIARHIGPHQLGEHNVYFASLNRNKKSVVIDLASEQGQEELGRLAKTSHALLTNLRPSAIKKLGLTYDALKRWNANLVCVALTGYGLDGPYAERPAYDYVIQATTGVMNLTGEPDGPPTKAGYSVVDNSTALMGAIGLLAKLVQGAGGQIDIAMYDTMLSQLNYLGSAWLNAKEPARRYANSAHPYVVPAQNFKTRDSWLTLFITHDNFWRSFCEEVGSPEWITDPKFATMPARSANREDVVSGISRVLETETTQHWVDRLTPLGIVVAPIETLEEALESEQSRSRGMIAAIPVDSGLLRVIGNPIKSLGADPTYAAQPTHGQDSEVLAEGADE